MKCANVRELLPQRLKDDLAAGELRLIDEHLATCPACRGRAERMQEAVTRLRAAARHFEPAVPTPDAIEEMLPTRDNRRPPMPWPRAAALTLLVVAAGAAVYLARSWSDEGGFAEGPQVPAGVQVRVVPPPLRVARSAAWDAERHRAVLGVQDGRVEARLSYRPRDRRARVRLLTDDDYRIPWPADLPQPPGSYAPRVARPAALLSADGDESWCGVLDALGRAGRFRVYLAGREPGGTLGALAFLVDQGRLRDLATAVTPLDLVRDGNTDAFFELRITKEERRVRYRWGHMVWDASRKPWDGGDVTFTAEEVAGTVAGPLIPDLATFLARERFTSDMGPQCLVYLEVAAGVTYAHVLRAVECARGDPQVLFLPYPGLFVASRQSLLPRPWRSADGHRLEERPVGKSAVWVTVGANGEIRLRGRLVAPDALRLPEPYPDVFFLHPHASAPWRSCLSVVREVRQTGSALRFVFAPEPGLPFERSLVVPFAETERRSTDVRIKLAREGGLAWDPDALGSAGRQVRLVVPGDATAEHVFQAVLHLRARGVEAFDFD
jgi:hypothetical protein